MEKYDATCTQEDCFNMVKEDDIERNFSGEIYPRSMICWDCRTSQDKKAIKAWRSKNRNYQSS